MFLGLTVWRKTFEGENIQEFSGFRATHKSFLHETWVCLTHNDRFYHSAKFFSAKWSLLIDCESFVP